MDNDKLTLKELAEELERLNDNRKRIRTEARIQNRKENPSAWYRMTHNYDGTKSSALYLVILYISLIIVVLLAATIINDGTLSKVGDANHPLEVDRDYYCPYCEWSGNVSQMETHDGQEWIYYYCPECGHVIGRIPFDERQG